MTEKFVFIFTLIAFYFVNLTDASTRRILERYCKDSNENGTQFYDLRSLSLKSGFLTVKNGSDQYLINICSNHNSFKDSSNSILCKASTSICLVNEEHKDGFEIANLHHGDLKIDDNNKLVMNFSNPSENLKLNGVDCESFGTNIYFICNKTRVLENLPEFKGKSNCIFNFEWQTSEACVDEHTIVEKHFKDESLIFSIDNDTKIDLNQILEPELIDATYDGTNEQYDFVIKAKEFSKNTKRNLTSCYDSFVCQLDKKSNFTRQIGKLKNTTLKHANDAFHLYLSSDSKCGRTGKNTSVIFNLFCDENKNATIFKAENQVCHYIFDVTDPKICEYEKLFKESNKQKLIETTSSTTPATTTVKTPPIKNDKEIVKPDQKEPPKVEQPSKSNNPQNVSPLENKKNPQIGKQSELTGQNDNHPNESNSNLLGIIIMIVLATVGIGLGFIALMDDNKRTLLHKRLRRVINPQTPTSFHYSQLSTNMLLINNNNQQQHENFNSPYSPTVQPKSDRKTNEKQINERVCTDQHDLRNNSTDVRTSIREQLDRLKLINDNDLGVSRNNFNSISFRTRNSSTDEEANLLN